MEDMNMSYRKLDLIMVDELGDEVKVKTFSVIADLDEDMLDLWKDKKYAEYRELYPEARRFYFERPFSDYSYWELEAIANDPYYWD